jgi:hypothetical protein
VSKDGSGSLGLVLNGWMDLDYGLLRKYRSKE